MNTYYTPSGKFSPMALVYLLLACVVVFPLLAAIYAYATWYIPLIYINFLITIGLGFAIGVSVRFLLQWGKVRNYGLGIAIAVVAFLVTYYIHWAIWTDLVLNSGESYGNERIGITVSNISIQEVIKLIFSPIDLVTLISIINEAGTWGIRSFTPTGIVLALFWLVEFGILAFISLSSSIGKTKEPFDEIAQKWFDEEKLPALSYVEETSAFKNKAEQGDWDTLLAEIQKVEDAKQSHSLFEIYRSGNEFYLSVTNKKAKTTDKGEVKFDDDEFIQYLRIKKETYEALKAK